MATTSAGRRHWTWWG